MSHQRYDLAIVGAGTAGLEIAKNASRSGLKVCLIEQGYSEGKSYLNKIPLLSGKLLQNDKHCLSFISKKQAGLGDRELPILQGIGFGGSSLINGNVSYLGFEKRFGEVFSFWPKNMFQRVKKHIYNSTNFSYNREYGYSDELTNIFCKTLNDIAVPEVADLDNFKEGWAKIHLNIQGSKRYNFSNDFKENAKHKNIEKLANTRAIKIFFKDNYASGVECENLVTKAKVIVNAKKIILSAGTIFSPLILMRSGIGDPKNVCKAGVPLMIHQEHVGKHLKDHANFEDSKKKLENLKIASQAPDIWNDRLKAENLFKEKNLLEKHIILINNLENEINKCYCNLRFFDGNISYTWFDCWGLH